MKTTYRLLTLVFFSFLLISSCGRRGPVGPQGPPGFDGADGLELLPTSFEFNVDLLPSNNFEDVADIPGSIDIIDEDVVLAFVLEDELQDGSLVWRQLPLTEFTNQGTIIINFDFTIFDVRVFMDANYGLTSADGYTDLTIRAVHIPAAFAAKMKTGAFKQIQSPYEVGPFLGVEMHHLH